MSNKILYFAKKLKAIFFYKHTKKIIFALILVFVVAISTLFITGVIGKKPIESDETLPVVNSEVEITTEITTSNTTETTTEAEVTTTKKTTVKKANTTKSVAQNTTALSANTDLVIKAVSTIPDRNVEYFNSGELIASSVQLSLWCGDQQIPNDKVIWFSNNALDISVDANGNLDYYLLGAKATITATYGEKSVSIKAAGRSGGCIREEKVPQSIWIKVFENSIDTNYTGSKVDKNIWIKPNNENTIQLVGVIYPEDCPDKTLTYVSSDPSVVSVDADGNIVGLKSGGRAAIIVTAVNGVDEHIYINVY